MGGGSVRMVCGCKVGLVPLGVHALPGSFALWLVEVVVLVAIVGVRGNVFLGLFRL